MPAAVSVLGREVTVAALRRHLAGPAVGLFLLASGLLWLQRRRGERSTELAGVLRVAEAHIPPGSRVIVVPTAAELQRLRALTDKPILCDPRARACYLLDSAVCYRFSGDDARARRNRREA